MSKSLVSRNPYLLATLDARCRPVASLSGLTAAIIILSIFYFLLLQGLVSKSFMTLRTFGVHPSSYTLLESAVSARVSLVSIDDALSIVATRVLGGTLQSEDSF